MDMNIPKLCQSDTAMIMLKLNGNANPGENFFIDLRNNNL